MSQDALLMPIREWLIDQSLGDSDIVSLFETLCLRLTAIGIPIVRGRLIWPTLHPLFQAETVIWDRGEPAVLEQFVHQDNETNAWGRSPMKYVVENNIEVFQRRLSGPNELLDYEVLKDLKEQGVTDYLILATSLDTYHARDRLSGSRGILVTWGTDRPSGFSSDDLHSLQQIQKRFAVTCKTLVQTRISRNITRTYLGDRAGQNVLDGQIRLGDGQRTKAVVWFSDLRGSTSHAETMEPDAYFNMLNSYFQTTAGSVVHNGGEVLDFIGDGVLGIFPYEDDKDLPEAAMQAHQAIDQTVATAVEVNAERQAEGLQQYKFGVGLNVGEVMFGNIGIPERLSFSVIGPSVNEVSRIEQMTKLLQKPVLAGDKLASLAPDRWQSMGPHKLEGVLEPVELFSFKRAHAA
ncbi:MAG: adenylate/guanylate cyclase domain-containing protein [Rhizobiaceae bacterium]